MTFRCLGVVTVVSTLSVLGLAAPQLSGRRAVTLSANQARPIDPTSVEDQVKTRATELYSAWRREEASIIWDLLSDEQKRVISRQSYIANVKLYFQGLKLVDFKITNVDTKIQNRAIVSANLLVQSLSDGQKSEPTEQTNWVFQISDRKWHYAGVLGTAGTAAMLLPTNAKTAR